MRTRVIQNWITTLIGVILFVGASYMFRTGKITWEEYVAILPTCLLLIRAKDSLLWGKAK